jgi:hypothetical protein
MLFFRPVRRARRKVQPRTVRKMLHPVRSTVWTASGVGRKRPKPRTRAAKPKAAPTPKFAPTPAEHHRISLDEYEGMLIQLDELRAELAQAEAR